MKKDVYVVTHGSDWGVRVEGSKRCSNVYMKKQDAITTAISRAKKNGSEVRIQNRDGRFDTCNSYGNDPCPPKDINR